VLRAAGVSLGQRSDHVGRAQSHRVNGHPWLVHARAAAGEKVRRTFRLRLMPGTEAMSVEYRGARAVLLFTESF
jgi:hypothetical protein